MDFGSLIAWLQSIWKDFWFIQTVMPIHKGVRVRFGKIHSVVNEGLHLKIPFADIILVHFVGDDTMVVTPQPLTTKDCKSVSIGAMALFSVTDIQSFLTIVNSPHQTIADIIMGVISEYVLSSDYDDIMKGNLSLKITNRVNKECIKYGVKIEYVRFADISLSKSLNLFMENKAHL